MGSGVWTTTAFSGPTRSTISARRVRLACPLLWAWSMGMPKVLSQALRVSYSTRPVSSKGSLLAWTSTVLSGGPTSLMSEAGCSDTMTKSRGLSATSSGSTSLSDPNSSSQKERSSFSHFSRRFLGLTYMRTLGSPGSGTGILIRSGLILHAFSFRASKMARSLSGMRTSFLASLAADTTLDILHMSPRLASTITRPLASPNMLAISRLTSSSLAMRAPMAFVASKMRTSGPSFSSIRSKSRL